MPDYQKMYHILFRAITDSLEEMKQWEFQKAAELLKTAQCKTEDLYMEQ